MIHYRCGLVVLLLSLSVLRADAQDVTLHVDAGQRLHPISRYLTGACIEDVNHEIYGGIDSQMVFGESFQEPPPPPLDNRERSAVSGMWRPFSKGSAKLEAGIERERPFVGAQSQRIALTGGSGEAGIENQGLNRWGMAFVANKPFEGYVWLRSRDPQDVFVALESRDGSRVFAETRLQVTGSNWQRIDFRLTPDTTDPHGRFAIKLKTPGSVVVGHAFLQPGQWGRFHGLPLRRDVVEGLIEQGITVLRYGGSMVNERAYRWKNMVGPRDRRPSYAGRWYPYSSNGWGILDFLDLCEAAGFLGIPAFNMNETPEDLADFIEYVNGSAETTPGGRKRAADGHPKRYAQRYMELGNEERVDEKYFENFAPRARAIWAKDPDVILVVGDFVYARPIVNPMKFSGAESGITSLIGHQRILELARQNGREVWFDVHIGTDGPDTSNDLKALASYVDALQKVSGGAKHKVVVFEFNAGNHQLRRALANAIAIGTIARDGRIPIATSANCLQPDRQNDNGWDQGLLFLNPSQVWLQPPGYVTQMVSRNFQPQLVKADVRGGEGRLDVTAASSQDGKTLVLQVVNLAPGPAAVRLQLAGIGPLKPAAVREELSGPLDAVNPADETQRIRPRRTAWKHGMRNGSTSCTFPAHSFTILRFETAS